MTVTNNFSISRTWSLTTLYCRENKRRLILSLISLILLILLIAVLCFLENKKYYNVPRYSHDPSWNDIIPLYIITAFCALCYGAASMFKDLASRQGRINMLMVPANASEKFLSRWIIYVVIAPIVFCLVVFAVEALRCNIINSFDYEAAAVPLYRAIGDKQLALQIIDCEPKNLSKIVTTMILLFFTIQSLFVLGSTIWHKNTLIKTFVVFSLLTTLYCVYTYNLGEALLSHKFPDEGLDNKFEELKKHTYAILIMAEISVCLFNYFMSWLRLRELDVITTKR